VAAASEPLAAILPRLGVDASAALAEGRVFIGRRRARSAEELVAPGEEVVMFPARSTGSERARILSEADGVVAAYKPSDMVTVADQRGRGASLIREVAGLIGCREAELHPTSRLDLGVSGVVLLARNASAQRKLAAAREAGRYRRRYVAIATRAPDPPVGTWTVPIGRGSDPRHRRAGGEDAKSAETAYALAAVAPSSALLAVEPRTGRTHQIRVHAADAGCPLLGDAAYGGPTRLVSPRGDVTRLSRIALHAAWVEITGPDGDTFRAEAPIPSDLARIWELSSGEPSAWARALARW
jgi:23S rRNA-/tRNA-specific pseudouridylate synthase